MEQRMYDIGNNPIKLSSNIEGVQIGQIVYWIFLNVSDTLLAVAPDVLKIYLHMVPMKCAFKLFLHNYSQLYVQYKLRV